MSTLKGIIHYLLQVGTLDGEVVDGPVGKGPLGHDGGVGVQLGHHEGLDGEAGGRDDGPDIRQSSDGVAGKVEAVGGRDAITGSIANVGRASHFLKWTKIPKMDQNPKLDQNSKIPKTYLEAILVPLWISKWAKRE